MGHLIFAAVSFVAVLWMVRSFLRANIMCDFCQDQNCKVWSRVAPEARRKILDYFLSYERREPDTGRFYVCDACRTVFDDFSGKHDNPEVKIVRFGWGPKAQAYTVFDSWCKVCNNIMRSSEPDNDNIHCRTCGTHYEWRTHEGSGYRFLMPPPDAKVKSRNTDLSGIG